MQKYVWGMIAIVLLVLLIWLFRMMPVQAWAVWNGEAYTIVAEGWGTILRAWPIALLGVVVGVFVVGAGLVRGLEIAKEQDYLDQIKQLEVERDSAVASAENRVQRREAEAFERERVAFLAEQRANQEMMQAKVAIEQSAASVVLSTAEIERAKYRTKNAVAAANRIKQKKVNP
jgi:ABC-type lipoprotein release transport system permease subunit